jgi:hypothetical protein
LDGGRVYAALLLLVFKLKSIAAARVTAITAMFISTGMIVCAIITWFVGTYAGGLYLGLVGVFVFYESHELWAAAKRDGLGNHSIFGRKCYQDRVAGNNDSETHVPAQNDDAVMT